MAQITYYFAGANSGGGFRNLFSEITDLETAYDLIILKGGPGVGKNTLMREVAGMLDRAGVDAEHFSCSGDPDSLDAVVFPSLRCAICDGTSPHVIEPKYPAAVDRYLDLGRFYDLAAAKLMADEVKAYTAECSRRYAAAYRALRAARALEEQNEADALRAFDRERAQKRARGIAARELHARGSGRGRVRRRFLGSITHRGYVWRFESVKTLCPKVYALCDRYGRGGEMLQILCDAATAHRFDVIVCPSPEDPTRIDHLLIPEAGVAFVTMKPEMEFDGEIFRRVHVDAMGEAGERAKLRLRAKVCASLREEAVSELREAKRAHDLLEGVYNPYVDFDGVHAMAVLEGGRLLSYLN